MRIRIIGLTACLASVVGFTGCAQVPTPSIQHTTVAKCTKENGNSNITVQANWLSYRYKDAETSIIKDLGVPWIESTYTDHIMIQGNKLIASKDSSLVLGGLDFDLSNALFAADTLVLDGDNDQVMQDQKTYNCNKGSIQAVIHEYTVFDEYIRKWNRTH